MVTSSLLPSYAFCPHWLGPLPPSYSGLTKLEYLDLSNNFFAPDLDYGIFVYLKVLTVVFV